MVTAPEGHCSGIIMLDRPVNRKKGRGAMVLGPVEFDPSADPRAGEPDECGLDHIVSVEEVIAVGLINGDVDPPAELGQHHESQITVLEVYRLPLHGFARRGDPLGERQGIHPTARTLVNAPVEKHGELAGVGRRVCLDHKWLRPRDCPSGVKLLAELFRRTRQSDRGRIFLGSHASKAREGSEALEWANLRRIWTML